MEESGQFHVPGNFTLEGSSLQLSVSLTKRHYLLGVEV
jgi:hypothetical protein